MPDNLIDEIEKQKDEAEKNIKAAAVKIERLDAERANLLAFINHQRGSLETLTDIIKKLREDGHAD